MPTGGLVGRPTKGVKRAKTAAATTARSLYRLQEQLEILKSQLDQDMAVVQGREKVVRAAEGAFAGQRYFREPSQVYLREPSYHHGCDPEVRVPETNTKKYNVGLLRSYKARSIKV